MPEKLYYSIGEVTEFLGVNASLLRYWEAEFPAYIKPHKNKKGNRYYTADDIRTIQYIYHLTRDCGYTLDGVREQLRHPDTDSRQELVQTLTELRNFLTELKDRL